MLYPRLTSKSSSNSLTLISQNVLRKGNFIVLLIGLNLKTFIEHLTYSRHYSKHWGFQNKEIKPFLINLPIQ